MTDRQGRFLAVVMMIQDRDDIGFSDSELEEIARTAAARLTIQTLRSFARKVNDLLGLRINAQQDRTNAN